jgi:hypothetical protein
MFVKQFMKMDEYEASVAGVWGDLFKLYADAEALKEKTP